MILLAGLWIDLRPARAVEEYTKKENKECAFCHPEGDLFALTEAGMYYAEHHTLEGYKPTPAAPKPESAPASPTR